MCKIYSSIETLKLSPKQRAELEQIDIENNKRVDTTEQKEIKKKYDKVVRDMKEWAKTTGLEFRHNVPLPGILPEFVVKNIMFDTPENEKILKNFIPEQLNEYEYFDASMQRSEEKTLELIRKLTDARPISKKLKPVLQEIFKDATIRVPTGVLSNNIIEIKTPGRFKLFRIFIKGHPQYRNGIDILPQVEEIIQTLNG
jgi:hypothetical protein